MVIPNVKNLFSSLGQKNVLRQRRRELFQKSSDALFGSETANNAEEPGKLYRLTKLNR
jgi:hypothetical protein